MGGPESNSVVWVARGDFIHPVCSYEKLVSSLINVVNMVLVTDIGREAEVVTT
jgi:hypothetical protein